MSEMELDLQLYPHKMWSRRATTSLIQMYQTNECLWMTTSPYYRNKQKRNEALINIAHAVSKLRPQTTAEDIKNKINGIRTQYVAEINKLILASNRGERYEPTLWCFEALSFLRAFTQAKQGIGNRNWSRTTMTKNDRQQCFLPSRRQYQQQSTSRPETTLQSATQDNSNHIIIKDEPEEADVEIIEEETILQIDEEYSSHSTFFREETSYKEDNQSSKTEATPPTNDSGCEDLDQERVSNLFSPSGIGAEITLVPKKSLGKRKIEEVNYVEEKKKKEAETNTDNKDFELENRIDIFGKFVVTQMKIITDKVLLLKLEHTIQNAIIEAQLKQIELDKDDKNDSESK